MGGIIPTRCITYPNVFPPFAIFIFFQAFSSLENKQGIAVARIVIRDSHGSIELPVDRFSHVLARHAQSTTQDDGMGWVGS